MLRIGRTTTPKAPSNSNSSASTMRSLKSKIMLVCSMPQIITASLRCALTRVAISRNPVTPPGRHDVGCT
jgi:hypothetical protein